MRNKRASLQIGVNTIVILVIAMILLGLAISFIRTIFNKAETVPGVISTEDLRQPATKNDPIRLDPLEVTLRNSDPASLVWSVYNVQPNPVSFVVTVPGTGISCAAPPGQIPDSSGLDISGVQPNTAAAGRIILGQGSLTAGNYLCKLSVRAGTQTLEKQFSLQVIV